ncbi:MAG: two-component regulator propeller domain-containing protein, partial [Balneolaceae bacterium]|nr:two-component regulator propeller domain-containing protein [Balneolaceae bacterium]
LHNPGNSSTISSNVILDIYQNEMGLWLATYGGGVDLFDAQSGVIRSYSHNQNTQSELSSDFVFVITPRSDGTLWFGTNLGGVNVFNPETDNFKWYLADPNQPEDPETIGNNDVRSIFEDSNGDMWIGAYGAVLNRYNSSEDRFYLYDVNRGSELYASVVQDIYEDRQGRLWFATRGGGLKEFIPQNEQFVTYSEEDGLPSNIVHAIEEDREGNLWLSTNNGISRFNRDAMRFSNYGLEDGIQSREFNSGSSLRDRDGYIYFGGVNGFNRFHPENIHVDSSIAPVILTDLLLFNESVPVGEESPLDKQISQIERLTLPHDASVITFEFAALDFSAQKGNQFAYMLEGFDEGWNYVGELRRATYTNLSPGEYTFKVRAANSDGIWQSEETATSLPLIITPPFWQTTWFLFTVFIALVGLIYFVYWMRTRSIRRRNQMLASAVEKRTEELQKANATKDKLFSIVAHDLINISTGLSGLSGLMKESIENNKIDEVKEYSSHLHNTISQFSTMLKNMLDWARSQTGRIHYDPMNFQLMDIVDEIIDQQKSNAAYKNIELTSSVDEDLEVYADPDMILVILRNLIANSLKFTTEGGKVEVIAQEEDDMVKVSVQDNGIGMSEEIRHKIFDKDDSVTTVGTSNEKGTGLGISLCKDFVPRNNGTLRADST